MLDRERVRRAFTDPDEFTTSPLYRALSRTVAASDQLLDLVAAELPAGQARLVFHTATRLHVPRERRPAFDAAIEAVGETGPLWWLSAEHRPDPDPRPHPARDGAALLLRNPAGTTRTLAVVDGHLRWIEPVATAAR